MEHQNSNAPNVSSAVSSLTDVTERLMNWSAAEQRNVLELRSKLEVVNQQVLEQAVTKELTDEGSTVRKYDLNNDASPVLNILNWVVHQDDGPKHSAEDTTMFYDHSTVQGPVHLWLESLNLPSTFMDMEPFNNGRAVEKIQGMLNVNGI